MIRWQAALDGASGFSQNTGLPARDRGDDLFLVGRAPGRDEDRVDVAVRDQGGGRAVDMRARQARRDLPGARRVDVVDGRDRPAGEHLGDPADVVLADHPHSDDADADPGGVKGGPGGWVPPVAGGSGGVVPPDDTAMG